MPVEINEVTTVNLVLVNFEALNNEHGLYRFAEGVKAFVSTGQQLDGALSLDIHSERISVLRRPEGNTVIKRDFPASVDELDRLAEVAELVMANTDTQEELHTFGFNVEASCTQSSGMPSTRYLAERFFNLRELSNGGLRDFGSTSLDLEFSDDDARWRINVRMLENVFEAPNLYVTLNRHHQNQELPDRQAITEMLTETWNGIPKFIAKLENSP